MLCVFCHAQSNSSVPCYQNNIAPCKTTAPSPFCIHFYKGSLVVDCCWLFYIVVFIHTHNNIVRHNENITHLKCQPNTNQKNSFFGCCLSWRKKKMAQNGTERRKKFSFPILHIFVIFYFGWGWRLGVCIEQLRWLRIHSFHSATHSSIVVLLKMVYFDSRIV